MSLKNKLNRLKPHLTVGVEKQGTPSNEEQKVSSQDQTIPYLNLWEQENVKPYFFDGNYCLVRKVAYPLSHQHGHYAFYEVNDAIERWNRERMNHPLSAVGHAPGDLFFFDTETTGLGGGTGNTIFLLGYATVNENSVTLTQHFLPYPGAEVALYQSFLESNNYKTLVTYNGKAFDWPQVQTRHTLVREHVPKLPSFGHFDLFHAARRMWKHKINRMKLTIVEKEILGFEREDDIPGFLAPMIYFDFLERKHPEGVLGVMKHNELDILSLISLYTHLSFQLLGVDNKRTVRESYEVGRWFSYLGDREKAKETFETIVNGDGADGFLAKHALAFEYKRNKDWQKAVDLWTVIAEKGILSLRIEACIELAKFYEHHDKDYQLAFEYCEKVEFLLRSVEKDKKYNKMTAEIVKRVSRLARKMNKK